MPEDPIAQGALDLRLKMEGSFGRWMRLVRDLRRARFELGILFTNSLRSALAVFLAGGGRLYGRYWGCTKEFPGLHFETAYYQGIEFCIRHGLQRFEPGAQGEHKIPRGFLPTETLSAHWLADARFSDAVSRHLELERSGMADYLAEMMQRSPYRAQDNC